MGISVYDIGTENDIGGMCSNACSTATSVVKNIKWTRDDAEYTEATPEPIVNGNAAPRLDSGDCGFGCTECREDGNGGYQCVDFGTYVYTHMCPDTWDMSHCMTDADQLCFKSFAHGDANRTESETAACRTVPSSHIADLSDNWEVSQRQCGEYDGLCALGCAGTCHNSWPIGDPLRFNSNLAMCRCMQ